GATDRNARVQNGVLPFRPDLTLIGRLPVRHHHADRAAQMLFIEAECFRTSACEIYVCVHVHVVLTRWELRSPIATTMSNIRSRSNEPAHLQAAPRDARIRAC